MSIKTTPNKDVVNGLIKNPKLLVIYTILLTVISGLGGVVLKTDNVYVYSVVAILMTIVGIFLAWITFKSSQEETSSIVEQIKELSISVNEMSTHFKLLDIGDTIFKGEEAFRRLWRYLALDTRKSFYAVSYMCKESWDDPSSGLQISILGKIKQYTRYGGANITLRRIFVFDNESEITSFSDAINLCKESTWEVRWVLLSSLISAGIFNINDPHKGFNISDNSRGAIYEYLPNRHVDQGLILLRRQDIEKYMDIFSRAWEISIDA